MAANVFEDDFTSYSLGASDVTPLWREQKQWINYDDGAISMDPTHADCNLTVVNSPVPAGQTRSVKLLRDTQAAEPYIRNQLSIFDVSAMNALTTYYVHFKQYIDVASIASVGETFFRLWEFISWLPSVQLWVGLPWCGYSPGTSSQLPRMHIQSGSGADGGTIYDLGQQFPLQQWFKVVIKLIRHVSAGGFTLWINDVEWLTVSDIQTMAATHTDTFFSLDNSGNGAWSGSGELPIYYADVQINQDDVWQGGGGGGLALFLS